MSPAMTRAAMMPTLIPASPLSLPLRVSLLLRVSLVFLVLASAADVGMVILSFASPGVVGGNADPGVPAGVSCAAVVVVGAGLD